MAVMSVSYNPVYGYVAPGVGIVYDPSGNYRGDGSYDVQPVLFNGSVLWIVQQPYAPPPPPAPPPPAAPTSSGTTTAPASTGGSTAQSTGSSAPAAPAAPAAAASPAASTSSSSTSSSGTVAGAAPAKKKLTGYTADLGRDENNNQVQQTYLQDETGRYLDQYGQPISGLQQLDFGPAQWVDNGDGTGANFYQGAPAGYKGAGYYSSSGLDENGNPIYSKLFDPSQLTANNEEYYRDTGGLAHQLDSNFGWQGGIQGFHNAGTAKPNLQFVKDALKQAGVQVDADALGQAADQFAGFFRQAYGQGYTPDMANGLVRQQIIQNYLANTGQSNTPGGKALLDYLGSDQYQQGAQFDYQTNTKQLVDAYAKAVHAENNPYGSLAMNLGSLAASVWGAPLMAVAGGALSGLAAGGLEGAGAGAAAGLSGFNPATSFALKGIGMIDPRIAQIAGIAQGGYDVGNSLSGMLSGGGSNVDWSGVENNDELPSATAKQVNDWADKNFVGNVFTGTPGMFEGSLSQPGSPTADQTPGAAAPAPGAPAAPGDGSNVDAGKVLGAVSKVASLAKGLSSLFGGGVDPKTGRPVPMAAPEGVKAPPERQQGMSDEEYTSDVQDWAVKYADLSTSALATRGLKPGSDEYTQFLMDQMDKVIEQLFSKNPEVLKEGETIQDLQDAVGNLSKSEVAQLQRALYVRGQLDMLMGSGSYLDPFSGNVEETQGAHAGDVFQPGMAAYQRGLARSTDTLAGLRGGEARDYLSGMLGRKKDLYGLQARQDADMMRARLVEATQGMSEEERKRRLAALDAGNNLEAFDGLDEKTGADVAGNLGNDQRGQAALLQAIFGE